ncbi:MAG: SDR family NAD(P)-dependent oxidoreductase, partial [Gaiella sp.]
TGVFVGVMENDYAKLQLRDGAENLDAYFVTGNHFSFTAGRISYVLGLHGPSVALDTACSSSLVAIHLACQSLRSGESDIALAGGVNLMLSPELTITMCRFRALSPDGRCKTFDESADGFGQGEGSGVVVLKRLSDAVAADDDIIAVIRGSAVNHDGPSGGLTVPSGAAQQAVVRAAIADAGVAPADVGYVEAHGTGTSLGDPIEVRALGAALGSGRTDDQRLLVGSVKANIGHLDSAAGVAGLIKVALALRHRRIPAQLHLRTVNRRIDLDELPIAIPTESTAWPERGGTRIGGVSSFGLSGTNAHIVLEQAPERPPGDPPPSRPLQVLALSARSEPALKALAALYANELETVEPSQLPDLVASANIGRAHLDHRLAVLGSSGAEMAGRLSAFSTGDASLVTSGQVAAAAGSRLAFLFTGQGAQYPGMARRLYDSQPLVREVLDRCDATLRPYLPESLLGVMFGEGEKAHLVDETQYTQPALFAVEYALASLWRSWGLEPDVVMGHSVGEYAAACVAGAFDLEQGLKMIAERGRLMQSLPKDGSMAVVFATRDRVESALAGHEAMVSLAAVNGPESTVVSGETTRVQVVIDSLTSTGVKAQMLNVSHAFHSPLMDPILEDFRRFVSALPVGAPTIPLVSNLSGRVVEPGTPLDADYWTEHLRRPVAFLDGMRTLEQEGVRTYLEVGPNPTLLGMGRRCVADSSDTLWLSSLSDRRDDWEQVLDSFSAMYVGGVDLDWQRFEEGRRFPRSRLPTYPFQRERYWLDRSRAHRSAGSRVTAVGHHPLLGARIDSPLLDIQFETVLTPTSPEWLADHRVHGAVVVPATAFVEMAIAAGHEVRGVEEWRVENMAVHEALVLAEHDGAVIQTILSPGDGGAMMFRVVSRSPDGGWRTHATGGLVEGVDIHDAGLDGARDRCDQPVDVEALYDGLRRMGLEYGAAFRGIAVARRTDDEVVGELSAPVALGTPYSVHPCLLDAALQLGLILAGDGSPSVFLPVSVGSVAIASPLTDRLTAHARVGARSGASVVLDIVFMDGTGRVVGQVSRLELRRASQAALLRLSGSALDGWLYDVDWQQLDLPSHREPSQAGGDWLLFDDGTGFGSALRRRLEAEGCRCTSVVPPSDAPPPNGAVVMDTSSAGDVDRVVGGWASDAERPAGAFFLWGLRDATGGRPGLDATADALAVFQGIQRWGGSLGLWIVTRGAQPAGRDPMITGLTQAPLWGLGATITSEHPGIRCVLVDLDPWAGGDEIEDVWREAASASPETRVAFRRNERFAARLVRSRFGERAVEDRLEAPGDAPFGPAVGSVGLVDGLEHVGAGGLIGPDGTYLVTGGLGGIGLEVARWLVDQGARNLVLVGRSGAKGTASASVAELEKAGARVVVAAVDVADRDAIAGLLERVRAELPPLQGVMHAAAVLDDGVLQHQSRERLEKVFAPKVDGAWNLHTLTQRDPIDFFVLFSSWAALVGLPGQGTYIAANAFLDALAHHRRALGQPGLAIDWGAWASVGLAASMETRDRERLQEMGLTSFEPELGVAALGRLMAEDRAEASVLAIDWSRYFDFFPAAKDVPFLSLVAAETAQPPSSGGSEADVAQAMLVAAPAERRAIVESSLREMAAKVLRVPVGRIDVDQPLVEMGLDSLMTTELFAQIERRLGARLPLSTLIEAPTVRDLAGLLEAGDEEAPPVPSWNSLVPIKPTGGRTPVFFIHAEEGNVLFYRDLARHLDPGQPFYGLQAMGLDGSEIATPEIAGMSAHYVEEIRIVQPHGPYQLGGFCLGGALALEMARQLEDQGEEVSSVVMVQSSHQRYLRAGQASLRGRIGSLVDRAGYECYRMSGLPSRKKLAYLAVRARRLRTVIEAKLIRLLGAVGRKLPHSADYRL